MRNKKNMVRTGLFFAGLISIGAFLFFGFSPFTGKEPASKLQQGPLFLDVPVIRQSLGTSCGEAAIVMAYNDANPQSPITEQEAIAYATAQDYFTPGTPPFTSPENMVKIAEYYAADVSTGRVQTPGRGLDLLFEKLEAGTPIIIDVLTILTDPTSEAHFIVVTGLSLNGRDEVVVHYNDPFTGIKDSALWSAPQGIWNAWQNNGDPGGPGWWLAIPPQ